MTTQRSAAWTAWLAAAWVASTGVTGAAQGRRQPPQPPVPAVVQRGAGPEAVDQSTQTLPMGASGSLELRNVSGNITVTAASGNQATLTITRRSRARTDADAKLGLDRVRATIDRTGNAVIVSVTTPGGGRSNSDVDVNYVVSAPAATRVTASSVSGNISITNITGDVSAQVINGDVNITGARRVSAVRSISGDIRLTDVTTEAALTVSTVSGDLRLLRVRAGHLEAETTSGDVSVDEAGVSSATLRSLSGNVGYAGTIVRGGRYEITSHAGDVRLDPAPGSAGFELHATTFSGDISTGRLGVRDARKSVRELTGTIGDGGATVVLSTFSGDVVVGGR